MKNWTIKKGRHYSNFALPKILISKSQLKECIEFTDSCRYNLNSEDQLDVNKLFGIGYFPAHRINSVRFGWRYDLDSKKMEILAYWYTDKTRHMESMFFVDIGVKYNYTINIDNNKHLLVISDSNSEILASKEIIFPKRFLGYYLKPFFGGNRPAPNSMTIKFS